MHHLARVGSGRFSQLLVQNNVPHHIGIEKIQDFVSRLLTIMMTFENAERFPKQFGVREMCRLLDLDRVKFSSGLFVHD